jgi:hypothetical protein
MKTTKDKPVDGGVPTEDVLAQFGRLQAGLRQTHDEIPRLLMRQRELAQLLGEAEVRGNSAGGLQVELDQVV